MALGGSFFQNTFAGRCAVAAGKVALNGARPKPSRTIRAGDHLNIRRSAYEWIIIVKGTSTYRRPARTLKHSTKKSKKADQEGKPPRPSLNLSGQPTLIA
jgi:ribosome-associated heat shock protein Hsp15